MLHVLNSHIGPGAVTLAGVEHLYHCKKYMLMMDLGEPKRLYSAAHVCLFPLP